LVAVGSAAAVGPGSWFYDTTKHQILVGDNPAGHLLEASVAQTAFGGHAKGVTVSNLVITEYATPAQYGVIDSYDGDVWTISNNEISLNHGGGVYAGSNSTVSGNWVHDNGQIGVKASKSGVVFAGNEIAFNNWAGFDLFWEAGGAKFWNATGLVFDANNVHDNHGFGAWSDYSGAGTVYSNNTFANNDLAGISHEASYSAAITANTFTGNGRTTTPGSGDHTGGAVYIYDGSDMEVANNTISANNGGVIALCQNRGNGQLGAPLGCQNLWVHNNTMTLTAGFNGVFASAYTDYPPYAQQTSQYVKSIFTADNIRWDYNTYHGSGFAGGATTDATLRFLWADPKGGDPANIWSWATRRYLGFTDWQAHGQDTHSTAS
jgi:parallel beta-helix repeat protein